MAAHDAAMGRVTARFDEPAALPGHSLEGIGTQKLAERLIVFTSARREYNELAARARVALPGLAQASVVRRFYGHAKKRLVPGVLEASSKREVSRPSVDSMREKIA